MRADSGASGGSARLVAFLIASIVLHGLLAMTLGLAQGAPLPGSPARPVSSLPPTEMVWFEGVGGPSSTGASAVAHPSVPAAPTIEPRAAPRVVGEERNPVATVARMRPVAVPSPAPVAAPEPAPPAAPALPAVEPTATAAAGASVAEATARESGDGASGSEAAATASGGGPEEGLGSRSIAGSGGAGGVNGSDLRAYARRLSEVVARQRRYPASAVRLGMEGTAHVQLRVRSDGSLMEPPRLVRSSGQEVLDAEALRMVEAAAPFESMPESASRPSAGFVIPVVFSLRSGN